MQKEFRLSTTQLGQLFAAFFWTYALLQLVGISGWLADRFNVRLVLAGGLAVWSAATVLTGVLSGFAALFAVRLLVGAGESLAYPCYSRIFATDIPSEHRGIANALIDAGSKLGPGIGTLLGGLLLATVGWRIFFVVLGIVSLLWLLPWSTQLAKSRTPAPPPTAVGPSTLEILTKRSAWGAFFGHFCGNYFWFFLLTWLPTYFVNERGFTNPAMIRITSISFFLIAGATLCAGWISDRWIARGGSPTLVRKTVVMVGLAGSTIILPVAIVTDPLLAQGLLLVACMFFGIYVS